MERPERFCHLFLFRDLGWGRNFLSTGKDLWHSFVPAGLNAAHLSSTCAHACTLTQAHTCTHNLVGEASVSVLKQPVHACCKQIFYTASPLSALFCFLARGSSFLNWLLSCGHPTVINKDTSLFTCWAWVSECQIHMDGEGKMEICSADTNTEGSLTSKVD